MYLKHLALVNFKNCESVTISLNKRVNCFLGDNGEGKTNILDAIHYLSFCKSYFNPVDSQNIKHNEPFFVIQGEFEKDNQLVEVYCGQKKGEKKSFKKNKKEYARLSDHIGLFPLVMISPSDSDLINDGSDVRRKFLDTIISQYDKIYLERLIQYNKALVQRNVLLKRFAESGSFSYDQLEVWDMQLVDSGEYIFKSRTRFIESLIPLFNQYYGFISEAKETVSINYYSDLQEKSFSEKLKETLTADRAARYTTAGIHKDDMEFSIGDFAVKKFGSQGQQKSFLIALKLAQYYFMQQQTGVSPVLLLDDIFDKLDDRRITKLMEKVTAKDFGQIFISDTNLYKLPALLKDLEVEFSSFHVKNGGIE